MFARLYKSARYFFILAIMVCLCASSAFAAEGAVISPNVTPVTGTARSTEIDAATQDNTADVAELNISSVTAIGSATGSARSSEQVNAAEEAVKEQAAALAAQQKAAEEVKEAQTARMLSNTYNPIYGNTVNYAPSAGVPSAVQQNGVSLGNYNLTFYCPCSKCCGVWANGITKTGVTAAEGRTIAVDTSKIPLGSHVYIQGFGDFIAEDIGSAIQGNKIDIFLDSHDRCLQLGRKTANVYLMN